MDERARKIRYCRVCDNPARPGKVTCSWGHEVYWAAKEQGVSVSEIIRSQATWNDS